MRDKHRILVARALLGVEGEESVGSGQGDSLNNGGKQAKRGSLLLGGHQAWQTNNHVGSGPPPPSWLPSVQAKLEEVWLVEYGANGLGEALGGRKRLRVSCSDVWQGSVVRGGGASRKRAAQAVDAARQPSTACWVWVRVPRQVVGQARRVVEKLGPEVVLVHVAGSDRLAKQACQRLVPNAPVPAGV